MELLFNKELFYQYCFNLTGPGPITVQGQEEGRGEGVGDGWGGGEGMVPEVSGQVGAASCDGLAAYVAFCMEEGSQGLERVALKMCHIH